jgi:hypothetical protein
MQLPTLLADSTLASEVLLWLGVIGGFVLFHTVLNLLIRKPDATSTLESTPAAPRRVPVYAIGDSQANSRPQTQPKRPIGTRLSSIDFDSDTWVLLHDAAEPESLPFDAAMAAYLGDETVVALGESSNTRILQRRR